MEGLAVLFGNRTGHRTSPKGGKLQAMANFFGNITTIVTSLILLGAVYFFIGPSWFPSLPPVPPGPGHVEGGNNPNAAPGQAGKGQELNTAKQALAFARIKQQHAVDLGNESMRSLDECLDEIRQYEALANPILTNDLGKKLAGDSSLLKRFRLVHYKERPAANRADRYRQDLLELVAPIKASLNAGDGTLPPAIIAGELERIQTEMKSQRDVWRKDRILLEVIVAEAKRSTGKLSEKSLEESVRIAEQTEAAAFAEAMEKESNRARDEMNKKAIEAKAEGIRLLEQAKIDKMLAEKREEAERTRTEAFLKEAKAKKEAELAKAKVEKERLVAKATDPKTKQMLAPILAKTLFQPVIVNGKVSNDHVGGLLDKISFTRLKTVGALDQTNQGLAALASVGCYVNRHPHWQFSTIPSEWSKDTRAFLEEVQALLREVGPTLVEERLLEP